MIIDMYYAIAVVLTIPDLIIAGFSVIVPLYGGFAPVRSRRYRKKASYYADSYHDLTPCRSLSAFFSGIAKNRALSECCLGSDSQIITLEATIP